MPLGMFLSQSILTLVLLTAVHSCYAQNLPWHLGSSQKNEPYAPSAINTSHIKAGPHQITVAVIDSGVMASHPSLQGQLWPGYDMLSPPKNLRGGRSADFAPDERDARCGQRLFSAAFRTHGTEVASLIAANGADGVFGVNAAAKILPIRLFGACGMSRPDFLDAIAWAAGLPVTGVPDNPHPARVINLSIAGGLPACGPDLQSLIHQVVEKKGFVIAAAGNNFQKPLLEPANCQGVVSVGALDADNKIELYSALDTRTTLYAPGGGKRLDSNEYWSHNKLMVATYELDFLGFERAAARQRGVGTSFAAPIVAGFISLWLSHHPGKQTSDLVKDLPTFLRDVEHIATCTECVPKGLVANKGIATP